MQLRPAVLGRVERPPGDAHHRADPVVGFEHGHQPEAECPGRSGDSDRQASSVAGGCRLPQVGSFGVGIRGRRTLPAPGSRAGSAPGVPGRSAATTLTLPAARAGGPSPANGAGGRAAWCPGEVGRAAGPPATVVSPGPPTSRPPSSPPNGISDQAKRGAQRGHPADQVGRDPLEDDRAQHRVDEAGREAADHPAGEDRPQRRLQREHDEPGVRRRAGTPPGRWGSAAAEPPYAEAEDRAQRPTSRRTPPQQPDRRRAGAGWCAHTGISTTANARSSRLVSATISAMPSSTRRGVGSPSPRAAGPGTTRRVGSPRASDRRRQVVGARATCQVAPARGPRRRARSDTASTTIGGWHRSRRPGRPRRPRRAYGRRSTARCSPVARSSGTPRRRDERPAPARASRRRRGRAARRRRATSTSSRGKEARRPACSRGIESDHGRRCRGRGDRRSGAGRPGRSAGRPATLSSTSGAISAKATRPVRVAGQSWSARTTGSRSSRRGCRSTRSPRRSASRRAAAGGGWSAVSPRGRLRLPQPLGLDGAGRRKGGGGRRGARPWASSATSSQP